MFTATVRRLHPPGQRVYRSTLSTRLMSFKPKSATGSMDSFMASFQTMVKEHENKNQPTKFPASPSLHTYSLPKRVKSQYEPKQLKRMRLVRKRLEKRFQRILTESPEGTGLQAFLDSTPESKCPREFLPVLCNFMFHKYETFKQFQKAHSLFTQMEQVGVKRDQKTYSTMIPMFARKNILKDDLKGKQKALELFQEMKDNRVPVNMLIFNTILYIHNRLGQPNGLESVFEEINRATFRNASVKPNKSTFGHIIDYYAKNAQVDRAMDYFEDMKKRAIPVTLVIYSSIINMFVQLGQAQRAIPFFEEMRERGIADVIVYNLWIEVAAKQDDHQKVMELFDEMHNNRITQDVTTYNLVIDVCGQRQERRRVEELFAEMKARRLFPDTLTYTALIAMYSTLDPEKAIATLEEMKGYGIAAVSRTYNVLIEMYGKFRWPAKAVFLFTEMKELGVQPDVTTYALLINMYRLIFQREKAIFYFEEMKAAGIEPNQRVLDLMEKVRLQREPDVYLSHFVQMQNEGIEATVLTYNKSIQNYAEKGDFFKAFADFLEMRDYGIKRNLNTFKILIQLYYDQRRLEELPILIGEMRMESIVPDVALFNQILLVFSELGMLQEALYIWEELKEKVEPNEETYSIFISFVGERKPELAIAFYEEMKSKNLVPTVDAQNTLIKAYASLEKIGEAEKIFSTLKDSSQADTATFLIMNDVYSNQNNVEKANSLFEEIFKENRYQVFAE